MVKKLFLGLFGLIYFSGFSFAGFGFHVRGGNLFGSSSFDKYNEHKYYVPGGAQDYDTGFLNYGADVFFEKRISNEIFGLYGHGYIGAKAGYTKYGESYYELYTNALGYNEFKVTSNAYAIPVMVYYKYEDEDNDRIGIWGGLGAVFLYNEFKYQGSGSFFGNAKEKETSLAVMPQLELGVEYWLTRMISVFLSAGYQFNGKLETSFDVPLFDETYVDYSGITVNVGIGFNLF